jgi:hypothetical protein
LAGVVEAKEPVLLEVIVAQAAVRGFDGGIVDGLAGPS